MQKKAADVLPVFSSSQGTSIMMIGLPSGRKGQNLNALPNYLVRSGSNEELSTTCASPFTAYSSMSPSEPTTDIRPENQV